MPADAPEPMGAAVPADEAHGEPFPCWALVVITCGAEPERVGQCILVPPDVVEAELGRGMGDEVAVPRLMPCCQNPGINEPAEALALPGISRRQLELRVEADALAVRNVGRCAMRVDGEERRDAVLRERSVLELGDHIAFVCVRRPERLAASRALPASHAPAFGEVDPLGLVGESPASWMLRDSMAYVAAHEDHVLVLGRRGSAMSRVAEGIHALSRRARRPLEIRASGRLSTGEEGAGSWGDAAGGGIVVLENVDGLRDEMRGRVLASLDRGGAVPGGREPRVLATTSKDLGDLAPDLMARFGLRLWVPPLEERCEDVPLLVRHLLRRLGASDPDRVERFMATGSDGRVWPRIDPELVLALVRHDYRADVTELSALLDSAIEGSEGDRLELTADVAAGLGT